jgi:transcriptional regulator with XRE-family HTH domain
MPRPESKTLGYLYDRFIGDDPERVASYEKALTNAEVACAIYELRTKAGLTQRALAERVGTTASVICQLEDADYEGHSLSMLRRVAAAVGRDVAITFPLKATTKPKTGDKGSRSSSRAPALPRDIVSQTGPKVSAIKVPKPPTRKAAVKSKEEARKALLRKAARHCLRYGFCL